MEIERCHLIGKESEMLVCGNCLGIGVVLRVDNAFDETDFVVIRSEPCPLCNEEKVCFARPPSPPISHEFSNQNRDTG